jgi:hypothetical protein
VRQQLEQIELTDVQQFDTAKTGEQAPIDEEIDIERLQGACVLIA